LLKSNAPKTREERIMLIRGCILFHGSGNAFIFFTY
jgi:hypothetical protein